MNDRPLPVEIGAPESAARVVRAVRPAGLEALLATLPAAQAAWLHDVGFSAKAQELALLPGEKGVAGAVLGLGADTAPHAFGGLAYALPPDGLWRIDPADLSPEAATLGFLLGAYAYDRLHQAPRAPARLAVPAPLEARMAGALEEAAAVWMVRDLVNTPSNLLGPSDLAAAAEALARRFGAEPMRVAGAVLEAGYPTVAAVGRGSVRPPVVAGFSWQGSGATPASPLIALVGKGVCFDSGGYDLKPSAGMLRMKKDMGGAAHVLGLARMLMQADLPVRLMVRIGCVENAISGSAVHPLDVVKTRRGLTVEIGNTDAEGRLVMCDLLAETSDAHPDLLIDCATLTGAARVALGPELAALFSNDDAWADALLSAGKAVGDPLWRLPLWDSYDSWLDSNVADLNNVSSKPMAGAVTAALYLRRFVAPGVPWIHLDLYAWNDSARPGRPEGGEAQAIRALHALIVNKINVMAKSDILR